MFAEKVYVEGSVATVVGSMRLWVPYPSSASGEDIYLMDKVTASGGTAEEKLQSSLGTGVIEVSFDLLIHYSCTAQNRGMRLPINLIASYTNIFECLSNTYVCILKIYNYLYNETC